MQCQTPPIIKPADVMDYMCLCAVEGVCRWHRRLDQHNVGW